MIVIVPDLPFSLSPIVEVIMAKIGYWLYLSLFYTTGETVLISNETIFAVLVTLAFLALMTSVAVDVRYLLWNSIVMRGNREHSPR